MVAFRDLTRGDAVCGAVRDTLRATLGDLGLGGRRRLETQPRRLVRRRSSTNASRVCAIESLHDTRIRACVVSNLERMSGSIGMLSDTMRNARSDASRRT